MATPLFRKLLAIIPSSRRAFSSLMLAGCRSTTIMIRIPRVNFIQMVSRCAQTTTSAVGPNAFYLSDTKQMESEETKSIDGDLEHHTKMRPPTADAVLKKAYIHIVPKDPLSCPVRSELHRLAPKMNERVFFYNG